jgi:hypothetical protein
VRTASDRRKVGDEHRDRRHDGDGDRDPVIEAGDIARNLDVGDRAADPAGTARWGV